jgi:hypothetical protein
MEHWCNGTDGKAEVLGEEPVSVTLCPPRIKLCMNLIKQLVMRGMGK